MKFIFTANLRAIILAAMIQAVISFPTSMSIAGGQGTTINLKPEAVETSLQESNSTNCNITSNHKLVIEVQYKPRKCKPQTNENLKQLFMASPAKSDCITLTKILLPGALVTEEIFIITTNSSCLKRVRMDSNCFPIQNTSHCSTSTNIKYLDQLGEDYFPRFVLDVQCGGCDHENTTEECLALNRGCGYRKHSLKVKLLKRDPDNCDADGFETWAMSDSDFTHVNAGCSCYRETEMEDHSSSF